VLWYGHVVPAEKWFASEAYQTGRECLDALERSVQATKRAGGQVSWLQGAPIASWRNGSGNGGVH